MSTASDKTLGVIGLGYVGLPLAVKAAERGGLRVLGFDTSQRVVEGVGRGRSHVRDVSSEELGNLVAEGRISASGDLARMAECGAISICVPTPLSKTRDPDVSHIIAASEALAQVLSPGVLVTLESTTYPGTTRDLVRPILEQNGLIAGRDFHLCYSPERIDPGNKEWHAGNTPRVIGGITPRCTEAGIALYSRFVDRMVPVSSTGTAEFSKILENTFRAVNIALANEAAMIADRLSIDIWEVVEAAATKPFGFMRFTPGPGLGGHCIPVDPHYLSWKMRTLEYRTRIIDLAAEINAEMPAFVARKVREVLNRRGKAVNSARVLLIGVAFKPDTDDVRESPAFELYRQLAAEGAVIRYHDPHVPTWAPDGERELTSLELSPSVLEIHDVAVILADHSGIDYKLVLKCSNGLVDTRRAIGPRNDDASADADAEAEPSDPWIAKA